MNEPQCSLHSPVLLLQKSPAFSSRSFDSVSESFAHFESHFDASIHTRTEHLHEWNIPFLPFAEASVTCLHCWGWAQSASHLCIVPFAFCVLTTSEEVCVENVCNKLRHRHQMITRLGMRATRLLSLPARLAIYMVTVTVLKDHFADCPFGEKAVSPEVKSAS